MTYLCGVIFRQVYSENSKLNMNKKLLLLIGTCLSGVTVCADTYSYLTFQKSDGSAVSVSVSSLTMTFADGKLVVSNGTDNQELAVADLTSMNFSKTGTSAIKDVVISDADGEIEAFSLQGVSYGKFKSLQTFKSDAAAGVYVIKGNGKTQKTAVR